MSALLRVLGVGIACVMALLPASRPAEARPIGGQFAQRACCTCGASNVCEEMAACACAISGSEGNLSERYRGGIAVKSAFGPTLAFVPAYNSMAADGSQSRTATVMGYGWTHTYNVLLFSQLGHVFRMDGEGRVTKYKLGPGDTYAATTGVFESLVKNASGTFTLRQKDGTTFDFALVAGTPFLIVGPVYRLTRITDRNNNVTTLTYAAGKLTTVTDTYGRKLTLGYTANNLTTVTDPANRTTRFGYDASGTLLTSITDPEGDVTRYSYNSLAQMTQKIDRDGRAFTYAYANGKPVAVTDANGDALVSLVNPLNWATDEGVLASDYLRTYLPSTTTRTDGRGNAWQYSYDSHGYLTTSVAPDGATISYTYDPGTLQIASATDANNRTTTYRYDSLGNVIRKTDALGNVTAFTYEPVFSMPLSVTDANGRVTTFAYDARGNRIQETDPLGSSRSWTFDSHGNVLTEKDKNGNVTAYLYDAFGERTQVTDALGNVVRLTYDAVGNLAARTNARGFTTRYTYDGLNRLVQETDALGKLTEHVYDGQGNRIQTVDRNGNLTRLQYDLRQRLVRITDALNQATTFAYDGNNNRIAATDKNGHTSSFGFDAQNRLTTLRDALGNVRSMSYDPAGNKVGETDANGRITTYEYDALNRKMRMTDPEAEVTQWVYDIVGLAGCAACVGPTRGSNVITKQIDAEGKVTYSKFDALDRLIMEIRKQTDTADVIDGDDAVFRYTYDPQGNRIAIQEPNGNTTTYVYDALNRQVRLTNAAGDTTLTVYDANGNVSSETAPNLNVTVRTYDALDRRIQMDDSIGRVASYTYDNVGNRVSTTDGNGNGTSNAYDAIYRIVDITDALGRVTHHGYDAVGNLLTLTDREGNITTFAYDAINRRTSMQDALGHVTRYEYDPVGNLTKLTDANGHATGYAFDGVNRPVKETFADGRSRTFTYDRVGNLKTRTDQKGQLTAYAYSDLYFLLQRAYPSSPADNMTYDLSGRMVTAERGGWLVSFAYDGASRLLTTTQNGRTLRYAYNIPGRTVTTVYPGGRSIVETTDARNRLGAVDDPASASTIATFVHDPGNRTTSRAYRNGAIATYSYNANNWIVGLEHNKGAARIAGFGHEFDREGNKTFERKLADAASSDTRSEAYAYDAVYRLIDYKVGTLVGSAVPVPLTQTQYTLDPLGNWNVRTKDSVAEARTHSVTNEITQIGAAPVLSDADGNTAEDASYRYVYDEENRLTSIARKADGKLVGLYQYDALSRRVTKTVDPAFGPAAPVETRYFYDDARVVEEQTAAGATQATYVYGQYVDELLTMDRGVQTYYYHQNSLWSVAAITDSAASVVERYSFDAYGCPLVTDGAGAPAPSNPWGTSHSAVGNPYLFTGREFGEETGLYFHRARYYDCAKGRFLQRDPLEYDSGMNLYEYVNGQPTHFTDPFGLAKYTNTYSRGNRFVRNPQYETNTIDITLDVNTSACTIASVRIPATKTAKEEKPAETVRCCVGLVPLKLEYKATASTDWTGFNVQGLAYALRKRGEDGGVQLELGRVQRDATKAKGNTLTANMDLGSISCEGQKKEGKVDIMPRVGGKWAPIRPEQTITWKVDIASCGVINDADIKLEAIDPFNGTSPLDGAQTRIPAVRLIKSTYIAKEKWEQPFPSYESEDVQKNLPKD